jgi:membrane protein insertase Oxa1/YidC/SpoIIIJ
MIKIKRNYSTEPSNTSNKVLNSGTTSTPVNVNVVDTTNTAANVVNSTSTWNGPIDYVQMLMEYAVETQHVPFWIAIVGFTVAVRVIISPATIVAYKNLIKSLIFAPKIRYYTQNMRDTYQTGGEAKEASIREFNQWKKENNYNPLKAFIPMFIQIPVFITVFFAIRRFAYEIQPEEFLNGGILWFHGKKF